MPHPTRQLMLACEAAGRKDVNGYSQPISGGRMSHLAGGWLYTGSFCTTLSMHGSLVVKTIWLLNLGAIHGRFYCINTNQQLTLL